MEIPTKIQQVAKHPQTTAEPTWLPEEVADLLSDRFFSDSVCTSWFLRRCYPDGPSCPRCGKAITVEPALTRFRSLVRFTCPHCQSRVKATAGTILHEVQLSPKQLFVLLSMLGLSIEPSTVARIAGVSLPTVKAWRDKVVALAEVPA